MTTMMTGRARKSLADQIDRLDGILDGLGEALQEAVADAVQAAVKAVLNEILAKPEVLARIAAAKGVPVAEKRPQSELLSRAWSGIRNTLRAALRQVVLCRVSIGRTCDAAWSKTCEAGGRIKAKTVELLFAGGCLLLWTRRFIGPVLSAVTLGGITAAAAHHQDPWVAGTASGLGGLGIGLGSSAGCGWLTALRSWKTRAE